jgi:signal transduction histidine kinase/ActR/RegA family two-component response regulator
MPVIDPADLWPGDGDGEGDGHDRLHPAVIGVLVLAALLLLTVGVGLWHLRHDTLLAQSQALESLATAIADELERGTQGVKLAMQVTRDELREGRIVPGRPEASAQLHTRSMILSRVRKMWVVGERGEVLAASSLAPPPSPRSFVPDPMRLGEEGISFSVPFIDVDIGQAAVAMAVRYGGRGSADEEGAVAGGTGAVAPGELRHVPPDAGNGWVVAEVPAATLLGSFARAALSPDTRMVVQRADGEVLAGTLLQSFKSRVEPSVDDRPEADAVQQLADGTLRLVQVRHMASVGLRLVMTRDLAAGLRNWRELAQGSLIALAGVYIVLGLLLSRMLRAERARRQSQRALQAERDRAALAFAAAREGNWDWEPATDGFYFSPRMKELMGWPRDADLAGARIEDLAHTLHPDDAAVLAEALRLHGQIAPGGSAGVAGGTASTGNAAPPPAVLDLVVRARHADGLWHAVRLRGTAARDAQGRTQRVAGVALDVTDEQERAAHLRQLEIKLGRAQKLESLGTLAGGVAHDFNNILAAVLGYGEMARQGAPAGSPLARHLDQVLQAALRGKAVVERILGFSRGGARPTTVFAVQPVIEQVLGLLAPTMDARIHVERRLDAPDLLVRGDATPLFEAVMNLCSNALHAMAGREGVLTVGLLRGRFDAEHVTSHGRVPAGEHVQICVADTGVGMSPDVLERLFEPFFSTRGRAGTGLGLTVVHGVVEDFGGGVDVQSTPGEGSRFTLYLPLAHAEPGDGAQPSSLDVQAPPAGATVEPPLGQGQVVLVVDDEPALVALAEELLAELGYEPVGCTDPLRALAELRADPQRFDLLLTDEVMPNLPGTQFAQQARDIRPDLPILLLSGWGGPQLAQRAAAAGIQRVLAKPIQRGELARALGALLVSEAPAAR